MDLDRSGKCKKQSSMAAKEWPKQHLGMEGKMVWKRGSQGVKESVWMLIPWQLHPRECGAKGLK